MTRRFCGTLMAQRAMARLESAETSNTSRCGSSIPPHCPFVAAMVMVAALLRLHLCWDFSWPVTRST